MRDQIGNAVGISNNPEVEAPVIVDAGLPQTFCLAVFLRAKTRMAQVACWEPICLMKAFCTASGAPTSDSVARWESRMFIELL
jgi:hypothetical protein